MGRSVAGCVRNLIQPIQGDEYRRIEQNLRSCHHQNCQQCRQPLLWLWRSQRKRAAGGNIDSQRQEPGDRADAAGL
jgi:hypothetical protein